MNTKKLTFIMSISLLGAGNLAVGSEGSSIQQQINELYLQLQAKRQELQAIARERQTISQRNAAAIASLNDPSFSRPEYLKALEHERQLLDNRLDVLNTDATLLQQQILDLIQQIRQLRTQQ